MMNCDWTQKVSMLIDGELASEEAGAVERHVADCFACQLTREDFLLLRHRIGSYHAEVNLLAQRQALQNILDSGRAGDPASPVVRAAAATSAGDWRERAARWFALPRLSPGLAAASVLLLVCFAAGLLMLLRDGAREQQPQLADTQPRAGRQQEEAKAPAAPAGPAPQVEGSNVGNPAATTTPQSEEFVKIRPKGAGGIKLAKFKPKGVGGIQTAKIRPKGISGADVAKLPREVEHVPFLIPPRVDVDAMEFREADIASAAADRGRADAPQAEATGLSAARHAEQAQQLLRSFRNAGGEGQTADLSYERGRSQELLYRNIVLRREAARGGNVAVESTLTQLEPILLDIANLPDKPASEDVRSINERMRKKNLVAMLQVAARD